MSPQPRPSAAPCAYDFDEIVRTQRARVSRALLRFGVATRDLADAEQDVFLVVHRRLHEFEGRASIGTWVYRIAMNVASDHRRRAHHRRELLCEQRVMQAPSQSACVVEQRQTRARIADAVDALPADKRDVFLMHELEELPMIEVAAKLRLPLKTAFSRLYAARRALHGMLRGQGLSMLALWRPRRLQLTWLAPAALCVMGLPGLAPQPAESHARRPAAHAQVERVEPTPLAATASAKPSAPQPSLEPRRDSAHRTPRAASARAVSKPVVVEPAPVLDTSSSTVATPTVLAFSSYHTGVEELRPRVLPELALARDTRGPSLPRIVMRGPRPATLMR